MLLPSAAPGRLAVNLVGNVLLADCFASSPGHPTPTPTAPTVTGSRSATTHPSATGPALTPWQRLTALADPIDTTPGQAPKKTNEYLPGGLHPYLLNPLLKDTDVPAGAVAPRELATDLAYPRLLISGVVALVSSQYLEQAPRATSLRVLADIPGITYRGQSTGLTFAVTADGSTSQLLDDPQSGEVLAAHERLTGRRAGLFSYFLILERGHTTHASARRTLTGQPPTSTVAGAIGSRGHPSCDAKPLQHQATASSPPPTDSGEGKRYFLMDLRTWASSGRRTGPSEQPRQEWQVRAPGIRR